MTEAIGTPTVHFKLMRGVFYPAVLGTIFYNLFSHTLAPFFTDPSFHITSSALAPAIITFAVVGLFAVDFVRRFQLKRSLVRPCQYSTGPFTMDLLFLTGLALTAIWVAPTETSSGFGYPAHLGWESYLALAVAIAGIFMTDRIQHGDDWWKLSSDETLKYLQGAALGSSLMLAIVRGLQVDNHWAVAIDLVAAVGLLAIGAGFLVQIWDIRPPDMEAGVRSAGAVPSAAPTERG